MNRFVVQSGSPCTVLLVRTKATLMRRKRTPEWHEKDKASRQQQMDKLSGEHELMKTQLNVLRQRLKDKNTVTSFRGVLVERTLTKRVEDLAKDLTVQQKADSGGMPWWGYKRNRPGNSKYSHWIYNMPRRSCYNPKKHKFSGSPCPICKDNWYPMYTEVEKIKKYIDPETNKVIDLKDTGVCRYKQNVLKEAVDRAQSMGFLKPPVPPRKMNWTSSDIYGRDRTELYGHRERYHQSYRHLPGNIHYEPNNQHWGHVPIPQSKTTAIQYE